MSRAFVVAALIASILALGKEHGVVDRSGLFGSCTALAEAAPGDGQWLACRPGTLTGYPDLSQDACTRAALRGETRYWICPTALVAARVPGEQPTR